MKVSNKNTERTIIVEFNGLPGLGKTTVANALINNLIECGSTVDNGTNRYSRLQTRRSPVPELFNLDLYRQVVNYAKTIPPLERNRKHLNWVNYFAWKYKLIEKKCEADFAIIDEGILQFFASIAHPDNMPQSSQVDAIVGKLKDLGISFIRVDCVNHVDEAVSRVISRPARGLAFESMSPNYLYESMKNWAANLDYLKTVFSRIYNDQKVVTIDTKDSVEKNVSIIKGYLHR